MNESPLHRAAAEAHFVRPQQRTIEFTPSLVVGAVWLW